MKIKQKKQLNLPQLIEWGFSNPELAKGSIYKVDESFAFSSYVSFPGDGTGVRIPCTITNDDTFTIEVEEEITEETEFETLIELTEYGNVHQHNEVTIKEEKRNSSVEFHALLHGRLVLIWTHDKGMVE